MGCPGQPRRAGGSGNGSREPRDQDGVSSWVGWSDRPGWGSGGCLGRRVRGPYPQGPLWCPSFPVEPLPSGNHHSHQPWGRCGWPGGRARGWRVCACLCVCPQSHRRVSYVDMGTLGQVHPSPILFTVSFVCDPFSGAGSQHPATACFTSRPLFCVACQAGLSIWTGLPSSPHCTPILRPLGCQPEIVPV